MSVDQFVNGLNDVFISATVKVGSGKGMIAYEPLVTAGIPGLPDEIALVSYQSKNVYDSLYSTEEGKKYQNLHWQYFDRSLSHSLTPESFQGTVVYEHAYDFHGNYTAWKEHRTVVLISFRKENETPSGYLSRANKYFPNVAKSDPANRVLDRVFLVTENYWLEYLSLDRSSQYSATADVVTQLPNEKPSDVQLKLGQGANVLF